MRRTAGLDVRYLNGRLQRDAVTIDITNDLMAPVELIEPIRRRLRRFQPPSRFVPLHRHLARVGGGGKLLARRRKKLERRVGRMSTDRLIKSSLVSSRASFMEDRRSSASMPESEPTRGRRNSAMTAVRMMMVPTRPPRRSRLLLGR